MKTKVTGKELQECFKNAFQRILDETYSKDEIASRREREKNFKKKSPKHGKMGPVKKDKYRNWRNED